ncbi:ribonuclease inhibitor-like [Amblyraja radiata]|uniref:ribonuclease inhibitor-like n=1 Tax=Amblyraja radiata TaxID=386614 RepID=UPI001402EF1A|nr:ribonuclease inhibitor-like [Amblyraja radiata]
MVQDMHGSIWKLFLSSKHNPHSFHELIPTVCDLIESFKAMQASLELAAELKDVQQMHRETLKAQTETLRVNMFLMTEKVKAFPLVDRYAELTIIFTVRDREVVEHELLARGRDHEEWREELLGGELEKIRTDQLFQSFWARKSKSGSSTSVAGVPGIGKTTMVQKIVYDWATGKIFQQFQFIFSFKFRDLNTIKDRITLNELILDQYPYFRNILREVWKNPEGLLFIFDGLDEFKDPGNILKLLSEAHSTTDGRFEVFLRFVAGLASPGAAQGLEEFLGRFPQQTTCRVLDWVKEEVKRRAGNTWTKADKMSLLNTMHYIFESQNRALAQQTLGSVETLSFCGLELTPIDCAVLSHVIGLCDTIKHLDLEYCRIQCDGLQRLGPVLHQCQHLGLGGNRLGDSGVKLLSAALMNADCKIQRLGLQCVGLTDSGAEDLVSALSTNHSLTELELTENKLGDSGVKLVSAALRKPDCKIQKLWLDAVGLTYSGAQDLVSALSTNPSLTELDLGGNGLGDSGVKLVSAALRNPDCKIQRLGLWAVGLTDSGADDLASALSTNRSLTELKLGNNELGDSGVKLVSAGVRNSDCEIQRLWLDSINLTDSGLDDLASALSTRLSLLELELGSNSLTDRSVASLRRLILALPSLERIRLGRNRFSADGRNQLESLCGIRPGLSMEL